MRRIIDWYNRLSTVARIFISALVTAFPFYFAALLSHSVTQSAQLRQPYNIYLHATIFIVLLTAVIFVARYLVTYREREQQELERKRAALMHAYTFIDRVTMRQLSGLRNQAAFEAHPLELMGASVDILQLIVEAAYNTFEATYGRSGGVTERVDFEVTFMTRSYIDREITIPAYANREGRAPRSMVLRKTDPHIYNNSVTAIVYREAKPSIHIIEDTSNRSTEYHELYPEQKHRIKSSIIFPVLCDKNELLGTLVVHCDQLGFFQISSEKYWTDMLEIFAKRLALVKSKLDTLVSLRNDEKSQLTINLPELPF